MTRCANCPVRAGIACPREGVHRAPVVRVCVLAEDPQHRPAIVAMAEADAAGGVVFDPGTPIPDPDPETTARIEACPDRGPEKLLISAEGRAYCGCADIRICAKGKGRVLSPERVTLDECRSCVWSKPTEETEDAHLPHRTG